MGTLESEAEIGVWVQAPKHLCGGTGVSPRKNFEIKYAKSCNLYSTFLPDMV